MERMVKKMISSLGYAKAFKKKKMFKALLTNQDTKEAYSVGSLHLKQPPLPDRDVWAWLWTPYERVIY